MKLVIPLKHAREFD